MLETAVQVGSIAASAVAAGVMTIIGTAAILLVCSRFVMIVRDRRVSRLKAEAKALKAKAAEHSEASKHMLDAFCYECADHTRTRGELSKEIERLKAELAKPKRTSKTKAA